jgi:glycosyltransferase 2 family protein
MELKDINKKTGKKGLILRIINIIVVVGGGIFLLFFLLQEVTIADIKNAILGVYKPSLIIGLILIFAIDFFRSYRAKILIGPGRISMVSLFLVSLVRNGFNMVLPARTGEISYIYVLKRKFRLPIEIGVSTLVIAVVFDLVMVFSMILISIIIVGVNRYAVSSTSVILIAAGLLVFFLLFLFYLSGFIGLFIKLYDKTILNSRLGKTKVMQYLYEKLAETKKNIEVIRKRGVYWKVYLITIPARLLKFTAYYFLIHAVLQPMGYDFADLPYWVIFLATAAAEMSAVLPTHSLAGLGTYQGAFALAFVLLGFSERISITVGFSYHIINLVFTVAWSLIALLILSMPFYRFKKHDAGNSL